MIPRFDKRTEAGTQLRSALGRELKTTARASTSVPAVVGELASFPLRATVDRRIGDEVRLHLGDVIEVTMTANEVANADPVGLIQRLERRVGGLDDALTDARADVDEATGEAERARARVGRPFEHAEELTRLVRRQAELTEALMPSADGPPSGVATPARTLSRGGTGVGLA